MRPLNSLEFLYDLYFSTRFFAKSFHKIFHCYGGCHISNLWCQITVHQLFNLTKKDPRPWFGTIEWRFDETIISSSKKPPFKTTNHEVKISYSEEVTEIWKNLPPCFDFTEVFLKWDIFPNFVAFSQYLNFTYKNSSGFKGLKTSWENYLHVNQLLIQRISKSRPCISYV